MWYHFANVVNFSFNDRQLFNVVASRGHTASQGDIYILWMRRCSSSKSVGLLKKVGGLHVWICKHLAGMAEYGKKVNAHLFKAQPEEMIRIQIQL